MSLLPGCRHQPSPPFTSGRDACPQWPSSHKHSGQQPRRSIRLHAKVGRRKKNAVQEEPIDEQIDWLQTNLLSLPEEAGRDNFTPEDRRQILMCLLDPEELEGGGEAEQATFNLLDEGEDAPDENDHARQELAERYNSEEPIRYFPQAQDPRLEWGATGRVGLAKYIPHFSTWQDDRDAFFEDLAVQSARARAEDLSLQHRARGASQFRLSNVMAQYMEDIENEDQGAPSDSPWDLPLWIRAVLRTEENWEAIEERAVLEDGDPSLVDAWTSGQKEGPYDRQTLLGEQEEPMLRTADMFMAHTLPGVEAGTPTYVEEPQEEGEEEEDLELLPDPVPEAGGYADPQKVRERFLAGRKLSESRIPLPPVGGEGAFEKD